MQRRLNITPRIILLLVFLASISLAVMGFLSYRSGHTALRDAIVSQLLQRALEKQAVLNAWFDERQAEVGLIASSPEVINSLADLTTAQPGSPQAQAIHDRLVEELRFWVNQPDYPGLFIMDPETGQVIAATDPAEEGKFRETSPYFIHGRQSSYIQNVYYSLQLQAAAITASAPVHSLHGRLLGVLAARLNLAEINAIVSRRVGLHYSFDAYLVNSSHLFVTQPRFITDPAVLRHSVYTEVVRRCLEGTSGIVEANDYKDTPAISAYRWIPERQLCLVAEMDQAEAFASTDAFGRTMLLISGLVLLVSVSLGSGLARTITRPISRLTNGVRMIGKGNLSERINIESTDEIGQLARAFNQMAANLQQSLGETAYSQSVLAALSHASRAVQLAQSPEAVYQTVGEQIQALGYHAILFTLTGDRAQLAISYMTFKSTALDKVDEMLGTSFRAYHFTIEPGGIFSKLITTGETLFTEHLAEAIGEALPSSVRPMVGPMTSLLKLEQAIFAPLRVGNQAEPIGILCVAGMGLTPNDAPAASGFANQIAIALENAQLIQTEQKHAKELDRRVKELTSLNAVASILIETLNETELINRAIDECLKQLDIEVAGLYLLDKATGELVLTAHRGVSDEFVQATRRMKQGQGVAGKAAQASQPHVMKDIADFPAGLQAHIEKEHIRSGVSIPLIGRMGNVGVMNLGAHTPDYFETADLTYLISLGKQIAIGLEKTQLFLAEQEAREFVDLLLESSPLGITAYDASGQCVSANQSAGEIIGAKREQVLKQNFRNIKSWQISGLREIAEATLASGESRNLEVPLISSFGKDIWVDCHFVRFSVKGESRLLMLFMDITDRKHKEDLLRRSEALLLQTGRMAKVGGWELDPQTMKLTWSVETYRIHEVDPSFKPNLENAINFYAPEVSPIISAAVEKAIEEGVPFDLELPFITAKGKHIWVRSIGQPEFREGVCARLTGTFQDITEGKLAEQALQAYAARLEQSNRDLQEFAYVASHDLQEPLRKILAFSDRLANKYSSVFDETGLDYLNRMHSASRRMQSLINDLLAYSRIATRSQPFKQVDLNIVAQDVIADLETRLEKSNGKVVVEKLPSLEADPSQMYQLLQNLIGNGLKFHHKARQPLIKVSGNMSGGQCKIIVKDNGIGFDTQYLDRIFKPFQRLHNREEYEGTGMGLAICRRIVERHGGEITAASVPGEGSTFIVTLPIYQSTGESQDGR